VPLNQTMAFSLAQSGKDVTVTAAGQTVSVRQSFRGPPSVAITCSTGHFLFDDVAVQ
jgi:hypothetical protein